MIKQIAHFVVPFFIIALITTLCRAEEYKTYYPDGTLQEEGTKINGKQDGLRRNYTPKGVLEYELQFKNGIAQSHRKFYEDGAIAEEAQVKDSCGESNPCPVDEFKRYYRNGNIWQEGSNQRTGYRTGIIKTYYPDGKIEKEEVYISGFTYSYHRYYPNGQMAEAFVDESGTLKAYLDDGSER